ncbi:hypothetical protein Q0Z83_059970 [Actinoplanes sichuanensis]|uniref:Uncharacterized protein n=1 Tax=Actinoplanes sichuanensis TaxID=512349 RepID=A0ABW4A6T2_9ACTN|nr:hypothetical protein [Actinoplanes sichuanensis]BEL07806.1 hypothetical protein Q0Z83_059970 [Actinoplanes sichuanensis]
MVRELPDRPADIRPLDVDKLKARVDALRVTREARIQAGRDRKN